MLDMRELAAATPESAAEQGLTPIVDQYAAWLDGEEARARELPEHLRAEGLDAVSEARKVQRQLADGLEHLLADTGALRCFRFMNEVMADQRMQSQVARRRAQHPDESIDEARDAILAEGARAALVAHLPARLHPHAAAVAHRPGGADKRSGDLAKAQLLFFPTGGGKTEAYLGLAAYTFAIRRLQGVVETPDGPLDGRAGVAVLMRYTLRLLTAQQFQRATALVCAAELARLRDPATWGDEPFRIGLWVGTDVSPKRYDEAEKQLKRTRNAGARLPADRAADPALPVVRHADRRRATSAPTPTTRRVHVYCGDELPSCPFAAGRRRSTRGCRS